MNASIIKRVAAMYPSSAIEPLTLASRTSAETFANSTMPLCRRKPVERRAYQAAGAELSDTIVSFQVFNVSLVTTPKVGDKVTDKNGVVYEVTSAPSKLFGTVFDIGCIQDK